MAFVRRSKEPAALSAWRKGAEGERRVAKRLHQLLDHRGVKLLHDRRLGKSRTNIDHLAVGPGGVTVIDAKNLSGAVRVDRYGLFPPLERLRVRGCDRTHLIEKLERQIAAVEEALVAAGLKGVNTTGALCLVDPKGLPLFGGQLRVKGLLVGGTKAIARLAVREGGLSKAEVDSVWRELTARFPAACRPRARTRARSPTGGSSAPRCAVPPC